MKQPGVFRVRKSVLECSRAWCEVACVQYASWTVQTAPYREAHVGPEHLSAELASFLFL